MILGCKPPPTSTWVLRLSEPHCEQGKSLGGGMIPSSASNRPHSPHATAGMPDLQTKRSTLSMPLEPLRLMRGAGLKTKSLGFRAQSLGCAVGISVAAPQDVRCRSQRRQRGMKRGGRRGRRLAPEAPPAASAGSLAGVLLSGRCPLSFPAPNGSNTTPAVPVEDDDSVIQLPRRTLLVWSMTTTVVRSIQGNRRLAGSV
jgi:hypothetical protein